MVFLNDINLNTDYLKAYEMIDNGKLETFRFSCGIGEVYVHYIKRSICAFPGYEKYFDIITPYGYGGQMIRFCQPGCESDLVSLFNAAFLKHCQKEKIISYFARFHPLIGNALLFREFFDQLLPVRKVVAMDLTKQTVEEELSKKCKAEYQTALARGTQVIICREKDSLDNFISMYYSAMRSKNALGYYLFPKEYFEYLFNRLPDNILLFAACAENKMIAYALTIVYGDIAYYHLACRQEGYNYYKTNYAINVAAAKYAKSKGCKYFVLGGGLTSSEDDSLLKFKKNFSVSDPFTFYIGKKILNPSIYNKLSRYAETIYDTQLSEEFFPKYRCPHA